MLDPAGAAFWPARRILIAADIHVAVPAQPFGAPAHDVRDARDARGAFERLHRLVRLYRPSKLIMLGHAGAAGPARLQKDELARLNALGREANFLWVGNHTEGLPGTYVDVHREGPFTFRHAPVPRLAPREIEICGALRPWASIDSKLRRIARPCFVADSSRLMLPAFGGAGTGQDVRAPAVARLFPRGLRVFLLGQEQLYSFALEQLGRVAEVA